MLHVGSEWPYTVEGEKKNTQKIPEWKQRFPLWIRKHRTLSSHLKVNLVEQKGQLSHTHRMIYYTFHF